MPSVVSHRLFLNSMSLQPHRKLHAMMIAHQTIDWTEAASQFEGIDEISFASDADLYHVLADEFRLHAKCETRGTMAHEVKKASRLKPTDKNQLGRFNH
jgi:hypothetical protein